jgi:hypothetical protein
MSIYSRIFAATSRRLTSAAISGQKLPPQALWAFPGFVGFTWFIWGALTDDIKQSVGLYYDPDAVMKRVEAERAQRLEAREKLKAASKPKKAEKEEEEEDEEEEDSEEEEVTAKDIEAAVNKAVAAASDDDDDDDDDDADAGEAKEDNAEGEDEEEEEEEEKPKKPKVDVGKLTLEEKWEYFAENSINPGDDEVRLVLVST